MTNNQKYNLFLDAVRIIRFLADVFEAIADTYRDATVVEADAKVIDAQEVKELPGSNPGRCPSRSGAEEPGWYDCRSERTHYKIRRH